MTRPFIRKRGVWWRIFYGHTTHHSGDYYSTNTDAHDAAVRLTAKENALR